MDSTTIGVVRTTSINDDTDNEAAIIAVAAGAKSPEDFAERMDELNLSVDRVLLVQIRNGLRHKRRGIHEPAS